MPNDSRLMRDQLIEQAAHLIEELDALATQVASIPDEILSSRPLESEPSIKEMYALLGLYDRKVYFPAIQEITAGGDVALKGADDDELLAGQAWSDEPFADVTDFIRETRSELVALLRRLSDDDWTRSARAGKRNLSMLDVVYAVIRHDAEILRAVAMRFHDMRPSSF